nr:DNA polymerase V subunit UmuC [Klebsiella pneumoniae]
MFAHCDVNAFYASCQTAFRPDLKGRPVVVLSNNDGCVIARSAEAKPFVKMGEPYFKQKAAFLRHGVVAFSSNYELYADMSSRVMATWKSSPRAAKFTVSMRPLRCQRCASLQRSDRFWPRNPRHGAAAYPSDAGRWHRPDQNPGEAGQPRGEAVAAADGRGSGLVLPAAAAKADGAAAGERGLGHRAADRQKLEAMGIGTVLQLAESDIRFIRKHFTVVLERTVRELRGEPCLALEEFAPLSRKLSAAARSGIGLRPMRICAGRSAAMPRGQ